MFPAKSGPGPIEDFQKGYATTDYRGCQGTINHGVFSTTQVEVVRASMISDGLSQTIATGEATHPGQFGQYWPAWIGTLGACRGTDIPLDN